MTATPYDAARLDALRERPIDASEKGFGGPLHTAPVSAAALVSSGIRETDGWLGSPRAVLHLSALQHNLSTMAAYCREHGAELYPHGKTTMSPQLVAAQLDAGATGVTVATVQQARVFRRFGIRDVLVANEVTDPASIGWLVAQAEQGEPVLSYVDGVAGVDLLERPLTGTPRARPLPVLVELGHAGGRSGARDLATARAVAEAVARSPRLVLRGVAGYEGSLAAPSVADTVTAARDYCDRLRSLTEELVVAGLVEEQPVVTAGGSAYPDVVVAALGGEPAWRLVLRSGCYLVHDHGLYGSVSPAGRGVAGAPTLRPALVVRAPVLSRPEPGTVVLGAGRRDLSTDAGLPVLLESTSADAAPNPGARVTRVFDQHLVVEVSRSSDLAPGDEVTLGISHPCTTFDKWRWLPVLDDSGLVVDVVRTFF